ncbi:hypothetical protein FIU86_13155 [Roseovarius sp. THAF9]|uniref:hypothetical protein n=1 Tax=Roseovarius sp. THAF9 TaxID=2587847 RepID=UPI0012686558|nr:hypothetical protein [Roseovarius sp. THAF9]QFT93793.1 hypothetical protein FIU86_13155 [Roseovarius sp. THAF9]
MSTTGKPDDELSAAFAAARRTAPEPDADFLARVLGDAEAVQDRLNEAEVAEREATRRRGARASVGWRGVFRALGGWPAVTGLSAAAITGLWLGVAPPDGVSATAQLVWGEDITLALQPDIGTELFPDEEG